MKWWTVALVFGLILTSSWAKTLESEEQEEEEVQDQEEDLNGGYENVVEDPCSEKECGPGEECDLDEDNRAVCVCMRKCPPEEDGDRTKVCSTQNVTFESECELHRQKCLCHKKSPECQDRHYKKAHLDYYGACKEMPQCSDDEMTEFPERMRDWFFYVMEELARREDLGEPARKLAREAQESPRRWVLPALWRFCDLDESRDRLVSPEELLPVSAPLKQFEHCTGPFLTQCDSDQSGYISLAEWGTCLGLETDEIEDMCDSLGN